MIAGIALLLAAVTFLLYWPSLKSDFVYDAREEILNEGFITTFSNLPDVLSLKVLNMNIMLGSRPWQLLYLMLIAAYSGQEPFGYHLASNLLHAINAALLFILLSRLIATEMAAQSENDRRKITLVAAIPVLIFAVHPLATESVAEISFSSSLLVTFFTLVTLLAATAFRPKRSWSALMLGAGVAFCCFASVASKESGIATAFLLVVYWFLFRRREAKGPWFLFLGAAMAATGAFLALRFLFPPPIYSTLPYLGGSFWQVFLIQPCLWVFMMGKLVWPFHFSANYLETEIKEPSLPLALIVLTAVIFLQVCLARKSKLGALGVAVYWLGLATVSNFVPLYCPVADRFYYLPLAGVAMQLLALLMLVQKTRWGFPILLVPLLAAIPFLSVLSEIREKAFANDFALWTDALQVNPDSPLAHTNMGNSLMRTGNNMDEAIDHYQMALASNPNYALAHNNLAFLLFCKGRVDEAITHYQKALEIDPTYALAHYDFGVLLSHIKREEEAIDHYKKALKTNPRYTQAYYSLGYLLSQEGRFDEAAPQFQKALQINPAYAEAHNGMGIVLAQKGHVEEALKQFQEAVRLKPGYNDARRNLKHAESLLRQKPTPP